MSFKKFKVGDTGWIEPLQAFKVLEVIECIYTGVYVLEVVECAITDGAERFYPIRKSGGVQAKTIGEMKLLLKNLYPQQVELPPVRLFSARPKSQQKKRRKAV